MMKKKRNKTMKSQMMKIKMKENKKKTMKNQMMIIKKEMKRLKNTRIENKGKLI